MPNEITRVIQCMLAMQRYPWEQGVCAQALLEAGREELWIPMAYDAIRRQSPDGRLAMAGGGPAVSDPAANGEVCLRAWQRTGNPFFLDGAQRMLDYLDHSAPRTADGIICHNDVSFEAGFSAAQLSLMRKPAFSFTLWIRKAEGLSAENTGQPETAGP